MSAGQGAGGRELSDASMAAKLLGGKCAASKSTHTHGEKDDSASRSRAQGSIDSKSSRSGGQGAGGILALLTEEQKRRLTDEQKRQLLALADLTGDETQGRQLKGGSREKDVGRRAGKARGRGKQREEDMLQDDSGEEEHRRRRKTKTEQAIPK